MDFVRHVKCNKYSCIYLPATMALAVHHIGGSLLLFKHQFRLSSAFKQSSYLGEIISCICNNLNINLIYRRPESASNDHIQHSLSWFTKTLNNTHSTIFLGDFNWELLRPPASQGGGTPGVHFTIYPCTFIIKAIEHKIGIIRNCPPSEPAFIHCFALH